MAISSSVEWEVRTGGSDTNGGGFKVGATGQDWTQQDAAQYSVTDGVTNGTTTITSATANFGTDVVGNVVYVSGGTGSITAGWYEITSRTNSTTIVVDRSTGLTTGTGATLKIGGAFATVAGTYTPLGSQSNKRKVWIRAGSGYTLGTTNIFLVRSLAWYVGYGTSHGDGTRAVFTATANNDDMCTDNSAEQMRVTFQNIEFDGGGYTGVDGFVAGSGNTNYMMWHNCKFDGLNRLANLSTGSPNLLYTSCEMVNGTGTPIQENAVLFDCVIKDNTGYAVTGVASLTMVNCLVHNNSSGGISVSSAQGNLRLANCTFDGGASGSGVAWTGCDYGGVFIKNCLFSNIASYSIQVSRTTDKTPIIAVENCAFYSITTPASIEGDILGNAGAVALTSDPYVDRANDDFRLNTTAGGGASCRAAGIGVIGQTNAVDIGAVQHADPAGGSGGYVHRHITIGSGVR